MTETHTGKRRIWELDFARGIAILIMIHGHFLYDLAEFAGVPVNYSSGFYYLLGRVGAFLFISIAGVSCTLSRSNFRRGFRLLFIALALTAGSFLLAPDYAIWFGILHFLSVSMLLYALGDALRLRIPAWATALAGVAAIALGLYFKTLSDPIGILFPLGITAPGFTSADYYPLFPSLGVFLSGVAFGRHFYVNRDRRSLFRFDIGRNPVSWAGRHSLVIYLVHQPVLIGAVLLGMKLTGG